MKLGSFTRSESQTDQLTMLKGDLYNLSVLKKIKKDEISALLTSMGFENGLSFWRNENPSFSLLHTETHAHVHKSLA